MYEQRTEAEKLLLEQWQFFKVSVKQHFIFLKSNEILHHDRNYNGLFFLVVQKQKTSQSSLPLKKGIKEHKMKSHYFQIL